MYDSRPETNDLWRFVKWLRDVAASPHSHGEWSRPGLLQSHGLTKWSDGVLVPQVSPLHGREVRIAKVEWVVGPAQIWAVWSEGGNIPPPWVPKDGGEGTVG